MITLRITRTVCVLIGILFLGSAVSLAQVSDTTPEGIEGADHLSIVSSFNTGSGTKVYNCWRHAGAFSGPIGCSDYGMGVSLGVDRFMMADFEADADGEWVVYRAGTDPLSTPSFSIFGFFPWIPQTHYFGLATDDPTVLGDYTGDGKADITVFRCNPNDPVGTQCYFVYRSSEIGITGWVAWGTVYAPGKADIPVPGDYDGDGIYDLAIRRPLNPSDPNSVQIFYIRRSSDGGFTIRDFGLATDKFVSGDFDGDRKTDFCAVRNSQIEGAQMRWFIHYSSTGTWTWDVPWGLGRSGAVGDYIVPGDYTGEGRDDIAVWRRGPTNSQTIFYILPSGATPGFYDPIRYQQFEPCTPGSCEYPLMQFRVH